MLGFRVWDSNEKRFIKDKDFLIDTNGELMEFDSTNFLTSFDMDDGYIPMQSTGLKDCDGVEIFEGDILLMQYEKDIYGIDYSYKSKEISYHRVVNTTEFLRWLGNMEPIEIMEVKGNIYSNPELLEENIQC